MIHNIRYRLFVYEDEDEEELIQGLHNILPTAKINREIAEGIFENQVIILSGKVDTKKDTKEFLKNLLAIDREELEKLYKDIPKKTDENGNLFLRFSKTSAFEEKWEILDVGDSIHLKIKIMAYPAKKEVAINLLHEVLDEIL